MADLLYYRKEREEFEEAFKKSLSVDGAEIVYKKLLKHFKIRPVRLDWTSGCIRPKCSSWRVLLNYHYNTFGVLCHEVGHLWMFQKTDKQGHNKKHKKIMKRMIHYCEKKNWFEEELNRRLAPKPVKPEPTKEELNLKLIARLENNCKRYQTKLKLYSGKLKKTQKKIERIKKRTIKEVISFF